MTIERHLEIEAEALAQKWERAETIVAAENAAAQILREKFGKVLPVWEVPIKTCSRCFLYEEDANAAAQNALVSDGFRGGDIWGVADYEPLPKWIETKAVGLPAIDRTRYYPPTIHSVFSCLLNQAENSDFKKPVAHVRT